MNALRTLTIISSSVLVSAIAFAKPVTVKDWSLNDANATCVASTSRIVAGTTYRFELSFDKSGNYPVEAWIRDSSGAAKAFRLSTEVAPIQSFAFIPMQDAAGNMSFWHVPTDSNALMSYIKRQTRLMVQVLAPNEPSKAVDFSLRGSSDIVDALVAQCAGGKSLVSADFEKSFVPAQTATMDPLKFNQEQAARLRSLYQDSVVANSQKATYQRQLTALNTQYAKQIQELGAVTGSLDQLTTKELVNLRNQKSALEQKIQSLDQQIITQQAAIDSKEVEVAGANAVYDDAWKVLAPYEAEYQRLNTLVQNAKNDLSRYQGQLSNIDQSIQNKQSALNDAQNQVSALSHQLSQLDGDIQTARQYANATDSIWRNFDYNRERYDRIQWHPITEYCRRGGSDRCDRLMYKVQNYADSETSKVQNRLTQNANITRSDLDQKMNAYTSVANQINNYQQSVIPNLQNQVSDLRNQRPGVEASVSRARDEVTNRAAAVQSYDQSVGYSAKKADVTEKANAVVKLQKELKALEQTQAGYQTTRSQSVAGLSATDKKIQDVLAKIQATQGRESELNKALVPYFAEKFRIETAITSALTLIEQNKAEFATILN
jgi:predicted  nucleic acid-binding Zn-ribbon protein